jgi:hypothetical protein
MNELIATIHFIGLALFSTQVPNAPGLNVLLPRVESHQHAIVKTLEPVAIATEPGTIVPEPGTIVTDPVPIVTATPATTEVEPHQAFIIYDQRDFVEEVGWSPADVPAHMIRPGTVNPPRYRFVRLTGERVRFHVDGKNVAVGNVPLPLPRPKCADAILDGRVAAVVSIPNGELGTCAALFGSERRYDTQLKLRNKKLIVITAESNNVIKALTLRGTATVYVANLPEEMLASGTWQSSGAAHYLAYYNLIKTSCAEQGLTKLTASISACANMPLSITGEKQTKATAVVAETIVDSECSNSAWP